MGSFGLEPSTSHTLCSLARGVLSGRRLTPLQKQGPKSPLSTRALSGVVMGRQEQERNREPAEQQVHCEQNQIV